MSGEDAMENVKDVKSTIYEIYKYSNYKIWNLDLLTEKELSKSKIYTYLLNTLESKPCNLS